MCRYFSGSSLQRTGNKDARSSSASRQRLTHALQQRLGFTETALGIGENMVCSFSKIKICMGTCEREEEG